MPQRSTIAQIRKARSQPYKPKKGKRAPNPLRIDPTRTAGLRRQFINELRKKFARLKLDVYQLIVRDDALGLTHGKVATYTSNASNNRESLFAHLGTYYESLLGEHGYKILVKALDDGDYALAKSLVQGYIHNVFCATGPGGGVDATCTVGDGKSLAELKAAMDATHKKLYGSKKTKDPEERKALKEQLVKEQTAYGNKYAAEKKAVQGQVSPESKPIEQPKQIEPVATPVVTPAITPIASTPVAIVQPPSSTQYEKITGNPTDHVKTTESLSSQELNILKRYKGEGYRYTNAIAGGRAANLGELQRKEGEKNLPITDSAMAKHVLDKDVEVYRGVPTWSDSSYASKSIGDVISHGIFTSTSASKDIAKEFATGTSGGKGKPSPGTIVTIRVPSGTHAVGLDKYAEINKREKELLVDRKVQYRVVEAPRTEGHLTHITLEAFTPVHNTLANEEQDDGTRTDTITSNAFCPTGEGGGQDNSCSAKGTVLQFADKNGGLVEVVKEPNKEQLENLVTAAKKEGTSVIGGLDRKTQTAYVWLRDAGSTGGTYHSDVEKWTGTSLQTIKFGIVRKESGLEVQGLQFAIRPEDEMAHWATKRGLTYNAFCPTGEGGGQDNSCSSKKLQLEPGKVVKIDHGGYQVEAVLNPSKEQLANWLKNTSNNELKGLVHDNGVVIFDSEYAPGKQFYHADMERKLDPSRQLSSNKRFYINNTPKGPVSHFLYAPHHENIKKWANDIGIVANAFCPTGEGGGQDNSCGTAKHLEMPYRGKLVDIEANPSASGISNWLKSISGKRENFLKGVTVKDTTYLWEDDVPHDKVLEHLGETNQGWAGFQSSENAWADRFYIYPGKPTPELRTHLGSDKADRAVVAFGKSRGLHVNTLSLKDALEGIDTNPSEAQRKAGTYKKGHIVVQGLPITIETPAGVSRDPRWPALKNHYGYIKRTQSEADGDHIDVFLGPNLDSDSVFIVDQNKQDKSFDEHKVMLGWDNAEDAKKAYHDNYSSDWTGFRSITQMTMDEFKDWLERGDTSNPVANAFCPGEGVKDNSCSGVTAKSEKVEHLFDHGGNAVELHTNPSREGMTNWLKSIPGRINALKGMLYAGKSYVWDVTDRELHHEDIAKHLGITGEIPVADKFAVIYRRGADTTTVNPQAYGSNRVREWGKSLGMTVNVFTVNPFVSEAQRRACYAKDDPNWDCDEWEEKTKELENAFCPTGPGGGQDNSCSSSSVTSIRPGTPEFDRWFEGSKVVDDSGNPLKMYHGTTHAFDKFSDEKVPRGHYFSSDLDLVDSAYASGSGANTHAVYLSIKNPAPGPLFFSKTANELKELGYDGHISSSRKLAVVFSSKQILSAITGNTIIIKNAFCPTGKGGGIDSSCPPGPATNKALERLRKTGGFTYKTGQAKYQDIGERGYSVSPYPDKSAIYNHRVTKKDIKNFQAANAKLLAKPDHALGAWHDPESGKTYLDVVIVKGNKNEAIKLGRERNQIAIFDFKHGKTIDTGGTGTHNEAYNYSVGLGGDGRGDRESIDGAIREVGNAFCPTGLGGGHDNSCSSKGDANQLTPKEIETLDAYVEYSAAWNNWLRGARDASASDPKDYKKVLDDLIDKQPPLSEPLIVYRGMDKADLKQSKNGEISDKAYMSTSTNKQIGERFALTEGGVGDGNPNDTPIVIKITIPAGKRVLRMPGEDKEILLPRGSKLSPAGFDRSGPVPVYVMKVSNVVNAGEFAFHTDSEKLKAFQLWLKHQIDTSIIPSSAAWEQYAIAGFKKGAGRAFDDVKMKELKKKKPELFTPEAQDSLKDFYAGTKDQFLKSAFGQPVAVEKIKILASRTFTDLKGVTDAMSTRMTRTLTDGLVQGMSPREIAKDLSDDIDINLTRATVIARTEIVRAHAEGQLTALEGLGVKELGVQVEWSTTGDDKVCEECASMGGVVFSMEEARGQIPAHPQCRCAWIPADVGEDDEDGKKTQNQSVRNAVKDSVDKSTRGSLSITSYDTTQQITVANELLDSLINLELGINAFCPTGEGGGQDNSCSSKSPKTTVFHGTSTEFIDAIKEEGIIPQEGGYGVAAYTTNSVGEAIHYGIMAMGGFRRVKPGDKIAVVEVTDDNSGKKVTPLGRGVKSGEWTIYEKGVSASQIAKIRLYDGEKVAKHLGDILVKGELPVHTPNKDYKQFLLNNETKHYIVVLVRPKHITNAFCPGEGPKDNSCSPGKGITLPKSPTFISSDKANVAKNEAAVAEMRELAKSGQWDKLKAHEGTPSPKVQAYKKELLKLQHAVAPKESQSKQPEMTPKGKVKESVLPGGTKVQSFKNLTGGKTIIFGSPSKIGSSSKEKPTLDKLAELIKPTGNSPVIDANPLTDKGKAGAAARAKATGEIFKNGTAVKDAVLSVLAQHDQAAVNAHLDKIAKGNVDRAKKEYATTPLHDLKVLSEIEVKDTPVQGQAVCHMLTRKLTMGSTSVTGDFRHELGHAIHSALMSDETISKALHAEYTKAMEKLKADPIKGDKKALSHDAYEIKYGVVGRRSLDNDKENVAEHYRLYHREVYRDKHEGGNGKFLAQYRERHPGMAAIWDAHYTVALKGIVSNANPNRDEHGRFSTSDNHHEVGEGWQNPPADWKQRKYGGVIFDSKGNFLLREPANHYDGYHWTFAKGGLDHAQEEPHKTALREVREETGRKGKIVGYVPGTHVIPQKEYIDEKTGQKEVYKGSSNYYFLMKSLGQVQPHDEETKGTKWASYEKAKELIGQSTNKAGRKRDLAVLDAAHAEIKKRGHIDNVFCPGGPGSGVDPTCSLSERGTSTGSHKDFIRVMREKYSIDEVPILVSKEQRGQVKEHVVNEISKRMNGVTRDQLESFCLDWVITPTSAIMEWDIYKHTLDENQLKNSVAQKLVDKWADTSADHDLLALTIQHTANKVFGLENTYKPGKFEPTSPEKDHEAVIGSFLRATYDHTQGVLKEAGISHLEVARGFIDTQRITEKGIHDVQLQPLSSFTTDVNTAESFSGVPDGAGEGRIVYAKVARERILSTALTGPGCLTESEVVVLGGRYKMKVGIPR